MSRRLRLWLIGQGIGSSPSPAMQQAALEARGIDGSYTVIDVDATELGAVLRRLREGEADGANVTIPHKLAAAAFCDRLEGDAAVMGAVNTLVREGASLIGDNTDARGLENALREYDMWPPAGSRAVILGGGGAAAAAVLAMSRVPVAAVAVVVRAPTRASWLAEGMRSLTQLQMCTWSRQAVAPVVAAADVVINATPATLQDMPFHIRDLPASALVVDLRYRPRPVDLVRSAVDAGHRSCDGLAMLLHQGMLSFRRWTAEDPPWEEARAALQRAVAP